MPAILDFDFARPASYDPTDMVGVACVRSLASSAHPGTYVGQDGLIKLAPHNLAQYSDDFSNGYWTGGGVTRTYGVAASPTGLATRVTEDTSTGLHYGDSPSTLTKVADGLHTIVVDLKDDGARYVRVCLYDTSNRGAYFDLQTGVNLGSLPAGGSASIAPISGFPGWYRCVFSYNPSTTTFIAQMFLCADAGLLSNYAGTGTEGVLVGRIQVFYGTGPINAGIGTTTAANGGTRIGWGPREPYQNLLLQTTLPGGGAAPTGWTQDVGTGSSGPVSSKYGSQGVAYAFSATAQRPMIGQSPTLAANTTYAYSARVEAVSGVNFDDVISVTGLPAGAAYVQRYINGVAVAAFAAIKAGDIVCIVIGGTYSSGTGRFRLGIGCNGNATGSATLSRPNLNVGVQAYNWYPTTSTAVYATPFDLVGNWECHGAMSEGTRTNLCTYSAQLDNAAWTKTGTTVSADATTSPDGATSADKVVEVAAASTPRIAQNNATTIATVYTWSVFAKAAERSQIRIVMEGSGLLSAYFNLSTGAVTSVGDSCTAASTSVGNGWWRCSITYTAASAANAAYVATSSGDVVIASGDNTQGIYIWGAQLEAGPAPSSYIPTTTVAVTRNADAISYTLSGAHATALSTAGTAVVEYRYAGAGSEARPNGGVIASLNDGTGLNGILCYNPGGQIGGVVVFGGPSQGSTSSQVKALPVIKQVLAMKWNATTIKCAANGMLGGNGSDGTTSIPSVTRLDFGYGSGWDSLNGTIKRVTIFSTALTDTQITNASLPVVPTAHWRTYDGTHRTASDTDKTVSCDIEADVDLDTAGEDGVQRVEFYVSVNGVLSSIATQTSRSQRTHNSTPAGANGFLTTWGYGITVDCSALAGGTITVDATVFSKLGAISYLPTLTIYNDTDGTDRRPSSAIVYYDYDLGDDTTGTGTFANPFKNPRAAMNSLSGDIGGATIRAKGRTVGMTPSSSYSASGWSTSGKWALTFEAVGTDKTWQRITPGTFSDPQDYILGTSGAAKVRMRFKDFEFKGPGPTLYVNGPNAQIDEVNCLVRSHKWTPADTNAHVDYEQYGSGGVDLALNGTSRGVRNSWGGQWKGVARGPAGYTSLFNFSIDKFLGIALQTSNDLGVNPLISNGELHFIRYTAGRLDGLIQTNPNFSQLAGANVTVSVQPSGPHAGKMRIEATNGTPNDFGTAAGHLVGSTRWGVTVSSATSGANNGTFAALEGGLNGFGRPYCILDNASAVGEVGSAGFNMDTGTLVGGNRYIDVIHTDGLQMYGPHVGAAFTNVRVSDCENMRSWVGSNLALTRCVLKNLSDGSHSSLRTCAFDFDNGPVILKDCIFSFLSINSNTVNFAGSFAGTNFVDVVFGNGNAVPTVGTFIHSCHFITGATPGTNPSSGAWFNTEPGVTPFDYSPSPGNRGTASGLQDAPPFWYHTGAVAASRGAWKNVATGNWSTSLGSGGGSTAKIPYLGLGVRVGFL